MSTRIGTSAKMSHEKACTGPLGQSFEFTCIKYEEFQKFCTSHLGKLKTKGDFNVLHSAHLLLCDILVIVPIRADILFDQRNREEI